MGRPATVRQWVRWGSVVAALVAVTAALAKLFRALDWVEPLVAALILAVVLAVAALVVALGRSRAERRRDRAQFDQCLRTAIAPVGEVEAPSIGVDPAAVGILGDAEVPPYVPRDVDDALEAALRAALDGVGKWFVTVSGPAKVGKSRTLFEALKRLEAGDRKLALVAPRTAAAARELLEPGELWPRRRQRYVLWLDDLEGFIADGIGVETLREWHEKKDAIVVATYGGKGDQGSAGDAGRLSVIATRLLSFAAEIGLERTSAAELDGLPAGVSESDREIIARYGLAAALVAAPMLERKLRTGEHRLGERKCPEGVALVTAAADWARCGRTDPIPKARLRELWASYVEVADDESFQAGLEWAREPVAGTVALVSGGEALRAYDYVVRYLAVRPDAVPPAEAAWGLALDLRDPIQALYVGVRAYAAHRRDDAAAAWDVAATGAPDVAGPATVNLGIVRHEEGAAEEALAAFRRAAAMGIAEGALNAGILLQEEENLVEAEAAYRRGLELGSGVAASNLGVLLERRGEPEEAERAYRLAMEMGSGSGAFNLGNLLKGSEDPGRRREAEQAFERASELGDPDGAFELGVILQLRGELEAAAAQYERAIELGPRSDAYVNLGVLLKDRDPVAAEAAYRAAMEMGNGVGASNLGDLLLDDEARWDEAQAAYERAIELGYTAAMAKLGALLTHRDRYEEGMALVAEAAELGDPEANHLMAQIRRAEEKPAEAKEFFRRAADLDHGKAAFELGNRYREEGNLDEAAVHWRRAMELDHGGGAYNLALRLGETADFEGARLALEKAIELGPEDIAKRARSSRKRLEKELRRRGIETPSPEP